MGGKREGRVGGKKLSGFANPCEKHAWNRAAGVGSEKQGANRASEAQFAHRTKRKKGKKKKR